MCNIIIFEVKLTSQIHIVCTILYPFYNNEKLL